MAANEDVIIMEEEEEHSSRRKVTPNEVGRGTHFSNPPAHITDELSIEIQPHIYTPSPLCTNTKEELLHFIENVRFSFPEMPEKPKIQRVPPRLREIESNKKCYDPLVVSIGPFHHGKPDLVPMEKFKLLLTRNFAQESKVSVEELYERVAEVSGEARKCYAENSTVDVDDEAFVRMMFLDGGFLLEFIYCIVHAEHGEMKMKSHDMAFVRRDMFLLENQLPFQVLKVLMDARFAARKGEEMIHTFIKRSRPEPDPELVPNKSNKCVETIKNSIKNLFSTPEELEKKVENQPVHLLELVRSQLIDIKAFEKGGCYLRGEWNTYRSTMELTKAGIDFRPGKSTCFSDIEFEFRGLSSVLTLPPITIDDSTKSMLLNLVAYEACPDTPDDFGVTSYICFMDSLIDHSEDVKELRWKGILQNFSSSDEEVAELFNTIGRDLVPNPHGFSHVKSCIEEHYRNYGPRVWLADDEWKRTHFRSPWTVVAFFAGIFAISLSVIQTVLAAIQTHLTAHPPR